MGLRVTKQAVGKSATIGELGISFPDNEHVILIDRELRNEFLRFLRNANELLEEHLNFPLTNPNNEE